MCIIMLIVLVDSSGAAVRGNCMENLFCVFRVFNSLKQSRGALKKAGRPFTTTMAELH